MSHIDRMVIEKDELYERLTKLQSFISSGKDMDLTPESRKLLWNQEAVMHKYLTILNQRINLSIEEQQ